jgi:hypothetical protein
MLGAMAVAVAGWPHTSIGADAKVTGASVCRRLGGVQQFGLQYTSNGVQNITGSSADLICNLPRDNTGNTNGLSDLEVTIRNFTTGGSSCDALSIDRNGNPMQIVRKDSTRLGSETLDFGAGLSVSANKGGYLVVCHLTNGSMINSVYTNEF